jgi:hypothetical protein
MAIIVPFAITLPVSIALYKYRYFSKALKIFTIYLLLNGLCNLIAAIAASKKVNNLPLLHLYTVLEFVLLSLYFRHLISSHPKIIYAILYVFSTFCIVNSLLFQSIYQYNSYTRSLSGIIIVMYMLFYFKNSLDGKLAGHPEQMVYSSLNSGLMIYFGGSFFLFAYANVIMTDAYMNTVFWSIHATLVLVMYVFFTKGLLDAKKY